MLIYFLLCYRNIEIYVILLRPATLATCASRRQIHWVQFGGVEEHFYRQLHSECSKDARARLSKFADCVRLSDLDRKTLAHLLQPLLRLRQACNHPQVAKIYYDSGCITTNCIIYIFYFCIHCQIYYRINKLYYTVL